MQRQNKRLAIISDCIHIKDEAGNVATENHIFRKQMEALAAHFEHTVIVCPFIKKTTDAVATPYTFSTIDFIAVPNVGGASLRAKWQLVKTIPAWIKAYRKAYKMADIFYLRMPNNISIPAFFYYYLKRVKRFATYTGTWENYAGEPLTYRFQKWILKTLFKGPVFAYIQEPKSGKNIYKTCSPSYSTKEWSEEEMQVQQRFQRYTQTIMERPVFITVGALVPNKNQAYILEVCKMLAEKGFAFYWYFVGDGYMKAAHELYIEEHNLQAFVCMTGKKTAEELRTLYRACNFMVQATKVEGFGKAPIEAMFHGVIPLLSNTAMSAEMTDNGKRGYLFNTDSEIYLLNTIMQAMHEQHRFNEMIAAGRAYVKKQTLENWSGEIVSVINGAKAE